jgi:hypothetical protein
VFDKNMTHQIGHFSLRFAVDGKLEQLSWRNAPGLLYDADERFELAPGRLFRVAGWDECFPTIDPYGQSPVMGELVGTAPRLSEQPGEICQAWQTHQCAVTRRFSSISDTGELLLEFQAQNTSNEPCEFVWASHALFSIAGLQEVSLPDGEPMHDLSLNGTCTKRFIHAGAPITLVRDGLSIRLQTDQPWWGLWINRGGWPSARPAGFACLGIEATNTASEVPAGAVLRPGETFRGTVSIACCEKT